MTNSSLPEGLITDEALEVFRTRVGSKLRVNNVFNEIACREAIRKFADGIGDPNPLWRNGEYAKSTSYKQLPAPPSWVASVFPAWVLQGLPGVHAFQTSAEWEFYRPVMENDRVVPECIFTNFRVLNSQFAGRSVLERQEARYYDQSNRLLAQAKVAGLRAERSATRQRGTHDHLELPHPWTEPELQAIEAEVLAEEIRGDTPRYWEEVQIGDKLPQVVRGPLGLSDIIAYCIGASPVQIKAHGVALAEYRQHPAWAFRDPRTSALEPVYGVHYNQSAASSAGLPYPYDTAVQRHCWLINLLTNWMGDNGWLKRSYARYRSFVYLSDVLWIRGTVSAKFVDDAGEYCVDIRTTATNQRGEEVMPGISTVVLPSREHGTNAVEKRMEDR